jgi:hypothetical protein
MSTVDLVTVDLGLLIACSEACSPKADAVRVHVVSLVGRGMPRTVASWNGCGHVFRLDETLVFLDEADQALCPGCLPGRLRSGDAVLDDPDELRAILAGQRTRGL